MSGCQITREYILVDTGKIYAPVIDVNISTLKINLNSFYKNYIYHVTGWCIIFTDNLHSYRENMRILHGGMDGQNPLDYPLL